MRLYVSGEMAKRYVGSKENIAAIGSMAIGIMVITIEVIEFASAVADLVAVKTTLTWIRVKSLVAK